MDILFIEQKWTKKKRQSEFNVISAKFPTVSKCRILKLWCQYPRKKNNDKKHNSECKLVEVRKFKSLRDVTLGELNKKISSGKLKFFSLNEISVNQDLQSPQIVATKDSFRLPVISDRDAMADLYRLLAKGEDKDVIAVAELMYGTMFLMDFKICEEILQNKNPYFFIDNQIVGYTLILVCNKEKEFKIQACAVFRAFPPPLFSIH